MNLVQFELLMQRDNEKVKKVQQRNRRSLMKLQLLFATVRSTAVGTISYRPKN